MSRPLDRCLFFLSLSLLTLSPYIGPHGQARPENAFKRLASSADERFSFLSLDGTRRYGEGKYPHVISFGRQETTVEKFALPPLSHRKLDGNGRKQTARWAYRACAFRRQARKKSVVV